jgi:hypothetical protein
MHVRLTRHWAGFKPQRVFCAMPDGVANALIRRRLAEEITAQESHAKDHAAEAKESPHRGTGLQDAGTAPGRRRKSK